ncbi:TetR/AcrR family transcriptional regulator [Auraticoccus monumenti]|uniref:DNA-binding transcriptional regulator, AcrR family n=1 Tax=Auraticoccus monumenti TaxID=675864 RepID=A0A1G6RJR4_9ACTN|nr:TetR/AcrR family transcriptional regulator [Auraticoccus monumenti]SDD04671.1 DNA-binding transcriptional regulator, AcrR family [Auraticoccus monumenti]
MTPTEDAPPGLWARSRQRVHAEITTVAMDLFLAKGFEQTTIEEVVAAAGISRRSFFRYFGTKEDVVLGALVGEGAVLRAALERQPEDDDVWTALRGALVAVEGEVADEERVLATATMVYGTPSLRARTIEKHLRWYEDLVPEVERRLGGGPGATLRAKAVVGCVVTCLDLAGEAWCQDGGARPLRSYFDAALDAVRPRAGGRAT